MTTDDASDRPTPLPEAPKRRWRVLLIYREPTYAAAREIDVRDYRGGFVVEAADPEEAIGKGRREFAEAAQLASVGWVREIVRVEVTLEEDG
jgi:hypothetical protein